MKHAKFSVIVLILFCSCAASRTSVNNKGKDAITDESVVMEMVVEEEVVASPYPSNNPYNFEPVNNIQFNPKYAVSNSINDKYDFYWEKDAPNRYDNQGIVDKSGKVILPHLFSRSSSSFNNYEVMLSIGRNNYGLYNVNELRWTIPMLYHELSALGNNLYSARTNNKWGVVDNNNVVVVPFDWHEIQRIHNLENYIQVFNEGVYGVYSIFEKKLTIPCEYASIRKLDRLNNFLVRKGTKNNIVDISNVPLFKQWYDEIRTSSMNSDYFVVKYNNRYGVIDRNEKIIVPLEYLEFSDDYYADGSYLVRNKEGKYGFMLIDGRVTLPFNYDNLKRGYNNNIVSIQNGKCGLVQVNTGTPIEIVTCEFDNIRESVKTFIVEKDKKFGLLNQYGKQVTAIEYTSLEAFKDRYYNNVVIYGAQKGNRYYMLDEQGQVISESESSEITPLHRRGQSHYSDQQFSYLKIKDKNGLYGIVDKVGKTIVKPQFDEILSEEDNIFVVKSKGRCGLYSLISQKLIVPYDYDLIIKSNTNHIGFTGKKIDFLSVKSDQVTKLSTME